MDDHAEGLAEAGDVILLDVAGDAGLVLAEALHTIEPVSYTHLDVYKRQGYGGRSQPQSGVSLIAGLDAGILGLSGLVVGIGLAAVGALDVYKRQLRPLPAGGGYRGFRRDLPDHAVCQRPGGRDREICGLIIIIGG